MSSDNSVTIQAPASAVDAASALYDVVDKLKSGESVGAVVAQEFATLVGKISDLSNLAADLTAKTEGIEDVAAIWGIRIVKRLLGHAVTPPVVK